LPQPLTVAVVQEDSPKKEAHKYGLLEQQFRLLQYFL